MHEAIKMVVRTSPVSLPKSGILRTPPRAENQRQPDYDDKFDNNTLFYDSVRHDDGVTLIGPPLLNLEHMISAGEFTKDNGDPYSVSIKRLDRTSIVDLTHSNAYSDSVTLRSSGLNISMPISQNFQSVFAGLKVLVTKSKNNRLSWISDWVKFHVQEQGIDAVLIYDNGSDSYSPEDVLEAIALPGIEAAIVVDWPFKFGPQGGNWNGLKGAPWDSDFCEYGIMEHARRRFLSTADGVLNADIDELVMTEGGKTVFESMRELNCGALSYVGKWIDSAGPNTTSNSHADYVYYDERRPPTTAKWAIAPKVLKDAVQWKTHYISGVKMVKTTSTMHRHFMAISLNWKWQRSKSGDISAHHQLDHALQRAMQRAFPSSADH